MIKTRFNKKKIIRNLVLNSLLFVLGFFILFRQLFHDYLSLEIFAISIVILTVGLLGLKSLISLQKISIDSDFLVVKNILNWEIRKIKVSDITHYSLIEMKDNVSQILISLDKTEFRIKSDEVSNFDEFLNMFSKKFKRDFSTESKFKNQVLKRLGVFFLFIGTVSLFALNITHWSSKALIKTNDYMDLSGVILKDPYIITSYGDTKAYFTLKDHPDFKFWFRGLYEDFRTEVGKGDTVNIKIYGKDYRKKISKLEALNFFDKYYRYDYIKTFEVKSLTHEYLSLDDSKDKLSKKSGKKMYWLIQIVILSVLLGGLIMVKTRKASC